MIDLPGVGPCPRPVDIDQSVTGFTRLKSLRAYRFAGDQLIEGESEEDEVLIVLLSGRINLDISGRHRLLQQMEPGAVLYMPPHHAYRLIVTEDAVVAYGRAGAEGLFPTAAVEDLPTLGEHLRLDRVRLADGDSFTFDEGEGLILVAEGRCEVGEAGVEPLSVVACADGDQISLSARGAAVLWTYSA